MQLHSLKRNNPNKKKRQVGRGGTRGKTSGRGTKGQNARSGHKKRPEMRDIIKKLPKLRGYRFSGRNTTRAVVNVNVLNMFENDTVINKELLLSNQIIRKVSGKFPIIKILGSGDLSKKISIEGCEVSAKAREKIEKAGGKVI